MKISSPMATGNGAIIVHQALEKHLKNYKVAPYPPSLEYLPYRIRKFSDKSADIIHTTPDYGIFHVRKNQRLVVTLHNYVLDSEMQAYSSLVQRIHYKTDLRLFTKLSLQKAHTVTAVSQFVADLAKKDMNFKGKIKVIPNGVDETLFTPSKNKKQNKVFKVLFSGNMTQRKGAHWLPCIIDLLPDNIQVYCATGLRTQIPKTMRHPKIQYINKVNYQDMPALYQSMDALLMPTTREGLSLSVLEAMACGLPVVASNCSSLPEQIIYEKGGYLCEVEDITDFADKLNKLAKNPKLRDQMGQYNRQRIEEDFTFIQMVNSYQELFDKIDH